MSHKAAYYSVEGDVFTDSETSIMASSILKQPRLWSMLCEYVPLVVVYLPCCVVLGVSIYLFFVSFVNARAVSDQITHMKLLSDNAIFAKLNFGRKKEERLTWCLVPGILRQKNCGVQLFAGLRKPQTQALHFRMIFLVQYEHTRCHTTTRTQSHFVLP